MTISSPSSRPGTPVQPASPLKHATADASPAFESLISAASPPQPCPSSAPSPGEPLEQALALASLLAARGRPREALDALKPALARQPAHCAALQLQGQCLAALGNRPQALAAYAAVLAAEPGHLPALLGCAALYKDAGLLEDALAMLERAAAPQAAGGAGGGEGGSGEVLRALAMVLTDLGTRFKLGGTAGWAELYSRALAACPAYPPVHYNLGVAAAEAGDWEGALAHYARAVHLEPRYAEAHCNVGVIHKAKGRLAEAIAAYERALAAAPNLGMVQANLAVALTDRGTQLKLAGDLEGGIRCYERALALRPRHPDALYNLGVAVTEAGHIDRAVFMYETALTVAPNYAEAHNNLGVLYRELGNMERAAACYTAALNVRPNFPQGLNNLAVIYTQQGRAQEALNLLQAALLAAPDYAEAWNNKGVLQRDVGASLDALVSYERCLELDPHNRNAGQNRLLGLNYTHPGESMEVCSAHAEWGAAFEARQAPLPPLSLADVDTTKGRPLVVGYISPDLFTHSVSYFAEAPLMHHAPSRVRHIVYSCVHKGDAKTEKLRRAVAASGGTWRDVARLTEPELAAFIRQDKVDVLVELTGHTASNRLGTMAMRPAPVQVTWIGYPNSTGLRSIDYRFTDSVADPEDTTQTFTEDLVRLAPCFLCYTPPDDAPPVAPLPALQNGFVTFGSFNALAKQTPEVLRVWARVLLAVPGSRLVLKNKPFACEVVRQHYWRVFEEEGVESSRVDLLPLAPSNAEHLVQYGWIDIGLDPWPYTGTTTTAEALHSGVPVLTLAGRCHAHNVGVSLLTAVGLQKDWVAHTVDDYVDRAMRVAQDLKALSALRQGLRERMQASQLCDGPGFVRRLEDVYHELWARWVDHQGNGGGAATSTAAG